ncbi:hypothetical protein V2O64_25235 (plasmid) [Verrucomicrobiaceae bacterium 227]
MTATGTWRKRRPPDLVTLTVWGLVLVFLLSILGVLGLWIGQAWPAISEYGSGLVTGKEWFYRDHNFGASGMIYGSIVVSLLAMVLATPLAFSAAIFISEYLPAPLRPWAKLAVEFLAAVPSVVYGLLGVILLRNWMVDWLASFDPLSEPGQTLTSKLGGPETHLAMDDPLHWGAMLSLGLILLVISALFVTAGILLRRLKTTDS